MLLGSSFRPASNDIQGEPEKGPHFKKFIAPKVLHRFKRFKFQLKAEKWKYFCDFARCLTNTRSIGKSNIVKISLLQND